MKKYIEILKNRYIGLSIFLSFFIISLYGQENTRFDHLSLKDGLSQVSIKSIIQDRRGYMWFSTEDGINRYNGYSFTIFKNDINNPQSLSNNDAGSIYEDSKGLIWVCTKKGLNCFNPETETFSRYFFDKYTKYKNRQRYLKIIEDKNGLFWIGTSGNGLIKFNKEKGEYIRYMNDPDNKKSLAYNTTIEIYEDKKNTIWISTFRRGLDRFDPETNIFTHYRNQVNDQNSLSNNYVTSITEDKRGNILIGTHGGGLNRFNSKKNNFEIFIPITKSKENYPFHNWVRTIFVDSKENILLGTTNGGVIKILSFDKGIYEQFRYDPYNRRYSLSGESIDALTEDNSGNIWIGTTTDGISILRGQKQQFSHFFIKNLLNLGNSINGFYKEDNGVLWYGTKAALIKYDNNKLLRDNLNFFSYNPKDPDSISGSNVICIFKDSFKKMWVGTEYGLNLFNLETEKFIRYKNNPSLKNSISSNLILSITEDKDRNLWIGTGSGGINMFRPESEDFIQFKNEIGNTNSIGSNSISFIAKDLSEKKILWIGTKDRGIDRFNYKKSGFAHHNHIVGNLNTISSNQVSSIYIYHLFYLK